MKSKENIEKKGFRRLSDEELKEVTGGVGRGVYQCPDGKWVISEKSCPIEHGIISS